MERTFEALGELFGRGILRISTNRRPVGVLLRSDIVLEDELQILGGTNLFGIQTVVTDELAVLRASDSRQSNKCLTFTIEFRVQRQVEEILQHIQLTLICISLGNIAIIDVDLRTAVILLGIFVIDEHVVVLVGHHVGDVMVVTHAERYIVRVGLAQIGLSVVGNLVIILIPIHGGVVVDEGLSVLAFCSICRVVKDFPSAAEDFERAGGYFWHFQTDSGARQYRIGLGEFSNLGYATLELQVNIHDMPFADGLNVHTRLVALLIFVEIDNGDDFFLAEVIDVTLAGDIERAGLHWDITGDGE